MLQFQILKPLPAILLLGFALLLPPSAVQAQSTVRVSEQNGRLSVQASNATAAELAEVLSRELNISVVVTGDANSRVELNIVDEPLDKALAQLSPNHLLVRRDELADSQITEVVLMMGENSGGGGGGSEQFLPSGSPADEILSNDEGSVAPEASLTDQPPPVSEASGLDDSGLGLGGGAPLPAAFDPVTGLPIDPETGLPIDPDTGQPIP